MSSRGLLTQPPPEIAEPEEEVFVFPASYAQQRLWFLDQLEPESTVYNMPLAFALAGAPAVPALACALAAIVRRHEALRTTFEVEEGEPVQVVAPPPVNGEWPLPVVDLAVLGAAPRRQEARRLAGAEAARPFDLARGPLLRTALLRLGAHEHWLLATFHHSVADGSSLAIFRRELAALYAAARAGRPLPLPELPIQYADFAVWQREWLAGEVMERQLAYWRQRLAGAPSLLELPLARPRPTPRDPRAAWRSEEVPGETVAGLAALARRAGATRFMTLLAAFLVLVERHTGQDDLVVGTPVAGRAQVETEELIGLFVNTLVLRADLSGAPTFEELLARVRESCLEAYAQQDLPFERLVEELQPERQLGANPLVQVLFGLQDGFAERALELDGLRLEPLDLAVAAESKFDLACSLAESGGGLTARIDYAADLFDAPTVGRLLESFRVLLAGIATDPGRPIAALPVVAAASLHQALVEWNDQGSDIADLDRDGTLGQLFAAQARTTPDALAVIDGEASLTYRQLDAGASRLARRLRALGVGPETLVGICLPRSAAAVTAILAVHKAGGGYVPLDPAYPEERIAFMLADSGSRLVLTEERLLPKIPAAAGTGGVRALCLDRDRRAIEKESPAALDGGAGPRNLAYVIYTSGSTGRPKGVAIEHRSAAALLAWARQVFAPADVAGVLAATSICFDLSVFELFVPLTRGGTVILAENALALAGLPAASRVTLVNTVPSAMVELLRLQAVPALVRVVNLAGEPLLTRLVEDIYRQTGAQRVFDLYGPSEDTTYSTFARRSALGPATIGRPIANTAVYLLDRQGMPVPPGAPGELCLTGEGLARGYLDRPELTAEKFLPDPFAGRGGRPGGRLYRTGDLARFLPDGRLEFLGRLDHQVKVRGFRIELGEIETHLSRHPAVREMVVMAREDRPGEKRLVAYVALAPTSLKAADGGVDDLRAYLAGRLPEYMVPSVFVLLPALPRTPNGKVDRRALPAPEAGRSAAGAAFAPPETAEERALAALWVEVLGVERVGLDDDFFRLGGHSLLATRVVARLRRDLGIELPLKSLFQTPTLRGLATALAAARAPAAISGVSSIQRLPPAVRRAGLPASFAQERLWFLDQLGADRAAYNLPIGLRLAGWLDAAALAAALAEVVRRHEALRTTFAAAAGGRVAQVVGPAVAPALPQVDLRGLPAPAAEAARIARQGARVPFDLARGPLLRVALVVLGEREHLLLVTLHHIVSDGWSMGVLVGELATLYAAFAAGRPSPLSELPIQYADFASWQREWLTGEVLAGQLEYWRGRLAGAPALLELPTDRPRPALLGTRGGRAAFQLSAGLTAALRDLCQRQGATLFMALLAAFQALLARYSRSADVVVGTPIANRTRAETEGLIGFFVNTLALRADLSGDPGFGALLARTKELTLAAYAHQDLPFEKLVEELKPERALSYSPLVQVMLILQNAPLPAPPAGELELSLFEVAGEGAKFDLTLALIESGETGGGMRGQVEYNRDLFDAATPLRLLGHFEALLRQAAADPARPLAEIDLLGAAERRQTLGEWNDTASDFPRDKTIHQLFAAQARATPAATALVCGDLSLTYRQLDARANRLARHLASLGVGPEVRVGLCLNRSLEAVVAILGILKAGGAYVPLDPAYPRDRLAFMLEDAAAPVVVTVASQVATLPDLAARGVRVVVLDREAEAIGREIARAPASGAAAANLAYVMYTSGSTGTPKGVAVTHRAVVRLVKDNHFAAFSAAERVLQLAPIAFDASTMEIWGALLNGSPLVVFPAYAPSLAELGAAIEAQGITTLWLTAGLFHQMVDGQLASLRGVRQLLAGGDVLSVPHVERALAGLPGTVLIDGYGPTENTTFTCCQPMRGPQRFAASVPIGRPIANTRAFLVDAAFLPIPIGVPGELLAGGDGLARGYLDRPDLTAEKFIPDAWSGEPGGRLYRTGDLARHLPDGRLEFLGRIDGQVKLRGFRIELGEIEAHLGQHPAVRGAVVAAREDMPGDRRLVAYVVARDAGARADLAPELRTYLRSRLPEHMVPSAFVALDALPLSPNGKVDRRALPAPELGRHASSRSFVAPRSPVEELLAGIWSAVLGLDAVSVRDNFFSLGGHSLLATQVVSRTREVCGVELPLRTLFEAPTIAELAPHVEAGRQRGLAAPPLVARPRREPLPASFAQERLWFLDQLGTEGSSYNVPLALQLDGGLDVSALAAALGELVRRHEALRTTFASVSSAVAQVGQAAQVVQVVAPDAALTLPALPGIDLRDLPAAGRTDAARRAAAQAAWAPFDLARGPLLRAALLRLAGEEHVLLLTLHHIVADGWSMGVLLRELAALYDAAREGRPSPLPALAVQYADFAVWQREWLQGPVLAELLAYWRGRLADAPAVLDLPLDRPRPALQTFRGGNLRFTLPPALRRSLADLGRRHGVSLFMTLLAAFQSLLARYTSAEDVVVGSPIANRNRAETEALIGFFVNTLVLRGDLSGDPTFAELLRRVRETTLDAYAHQDLPFEKLVEELRPERALSHSPLFQAMLILQNAPGAAPRLPGLRARPFTVGGEGTKFDLTLAFMEAEQRIAGQVEYNRDLFEAATMERLAAHFQALLAAAAADPALPAGDLDLLAAGERWQLLGEWNDTAADFPADPADSLLHEHFAAQAARTPATVALIAGDESLTYRELDVRANRLAHRLRALGVGPEVRVGIAMERTADLLVGLLAILKAGGAYVPLDPAYPRERLAFILADAQEGIAEPVLLIQERLLDRLPGFRGRALCVDREREAIAGESAAAPPDEVLPGNLAYMIYTSGSTGRPKGVAIEHRSACALLHWASGVFTAEQLAGVLAATSITFDLSIFEIFLPLARGGTVILAADALALADLPAAAEVTLVNTVPSAIAELLRLGAIPASVATVNLAGEPLKRALVDRLHERPQIEAVYNLYGPSEDTTYSTFTRVPRGAAAEPTIGIPVAGTRAYVLDRRQRALPIGVPGELLLGGAGLARGYLNRPDLTAASFVPDPFGGAGERLYRTGDLARRLSDGQLEFLGRIDHQVKVRGFRIELGEIEVTLLAHPGVREAVVLAREDAPGAPGDQRLVAYAVAAEAERPPSGADLRAHLAERLPEHMIPAAFVVLPALPLLPNGKVDRKALPAPEQEGAGAAGYDAPRGPMEELLAGIWSELLRVGRVGIHDSFFALGGHSLLATQVMSRVREVLGVEVPLRRLFEAPTVAGLAAQVERAQEAKAAGRGERRLAAPPLVRRQEEGHSPASFPQERLWFLDQLGVGGAAYHLPNALRLSGRLDRPALAAALNELVRRHESLRTTFSTAGADVVQVVAPPLAVALPVVDLSALPTLQAAEAESERLLRDEARRPFDLERGPLFRSGLLRLAETEHVLLLTMHHIVSDGWSTGVLLRELAALYAAFLAGRPSPLPELPIQYADFARWQRQWLRGEALAAQIDYWRGRMAGAPAILELPIDHPRPALQSFRGARRAAELPAGLAAALHDLCRRQGVSLYMALFAGFATLLSRHSGQEDLTIGSPIANRNRIETEGLIGFFVNTLVLRADLAGDPSFAELLRRTRDVTLDAYAHQDLPFEKLVEELRPERDLSHSPLFQVMLILQNNPPARPELPGLTWSGRELDSGTAKFDLNLALAEIPGQPGIRAGIEYNRDLFEAVTVARLLWQLENLLAGAAADPERRLSELPLLAPAELQQQLHEWNDTAAPYPRDLCLHQPFEARAAAAPDAPALFFGGERWSYGELNRRANQLAHRLVSLGVGPGRLVAVYLERGCEMVAAVLAVHKAGGAYVPLEGSWPLERIHWILANKGIAHVVTQAGRLGVVQALPPLPALAHVVCVDRLGGEATAGAGAAALWSLADIERLPATDPKLRSGADDLAYIIFTSGSTGKPKGVMVRHQPAVNLVHWVNHRFRVGPADRLLFITALSFDLSVYDLFGMLAAGGSVRIAATSEVRDPEALVGILRREPITFWDSAPAALQQLVSYFPAAGSAAPADREGALRLVFLSGDWIPLSLPDRVREAFPRARVVSLGGATEATIWSNFFPVGTVDPSWASIPYGRPIENARYHILDGHLNPSPIGVPGDLYIGGECLSSGYVNEPEMTAEKYIPDLLGGEPGARLYRTGDRARYWPDGTMEFLGRVDTQVKVRGFRIELGEIESVLGSHPSVREAVVLAREDTPGDQRLVAYVIPQGGEAPPIAPLDLRRFVQTKLPDYMVPAAFVTRESWPLSPTGKLDRKALPAPDAPASTLASGAAVVAEFAPPQTALERTIAGIWREVIGIEAVGTRENFFDLGGHSLLMARVHAKLQEALDRKLSLVDLFQFPTVASLAEHLGGGQAPAAAARAPSARTRIERAGSEIAVVGLAGRFPGARDVEEYWRNLRDGVESIRFFSDEELLAAAFPQELLSDPRLVKARGVLDGADLFDAAFFDYSPREAQIMDPQQRIFLECAWEALENAGYSPERYGGRIGVYGGVTENTYLWNLYSRPELIAAVGRHQISIANNHDFLPTRVSYKLNLRGPSINVQTACSTSLVAVHLACESLLLGDCDMALAGGVSVQAREIGGYLYAEGGIASPDGHTRAFDARARGVVSGSGVGLVVLKRLEDALADGDTVHAVIRGTASNNDGGRKVGFTAPSALGQAAAVRAALEQAGVEPKTVRYVEAHGTGTELGDPIEIAGLTQAFDTPERGFCAIGSAKTNIGHLDAAAGVAGLIKTVLALEHRQIPPSLHFEAPNPNIDFTASPFYVNARLADWPADGTPRRAGVSSFGIGGTNAHAVLEEAPAAAPSGPSRPAQLLLLSAKTAAALDRAAANLAAHLESHPEIDLADAAYTLQVGRNGLRHRRMLVAAGCEDAVAALRSHPSDGPEKRERSATAVHEPGERPIAFLFPGQGSQYAGMGAEIYVGEPIFRAALDECALLLQPELGLDLRAILYPDPDDAAAGERAAHELGQTGLTQPALFAVEYALARLWMSWGIRPRAMIGHSIGEYVAACLAGVFPLADALRLVAARGRLMQALPPGAMLGVGLAEAAVRCELNAEVDIELAAVNGPRSSVVSGTVEAVSALEERLQARGVECRRLHTSHAFHSAGMDPILPVFRERVASVDLRPPEIPFLSNVTGTWITAAEATDPGYWARHLRQPVRFADGLSELLGQPAPILLEVGPGRTLSVLARQHPGKGKAAAITSLPHARERRSDLQSVLGALGRLWLAGAEVDWAGLYAGERRRRVPLPTYPFERKRFWIDAAPRAGAVAETGRVPETPAEAEPAGGAAVDEGRAGYLAPRNEVEEGVARLVGEMLGIPRVGIHDDVFELGGSSLMAVQLGSRLRQRFAVELSSNFLLEASTVAALAELIQARQGPAGAAAGPRPSCLVRLQAGSAASRPLFMVHQVGGNVYTFRALGRELGRDQTLYGLRSLGLEEGEEPLASVEEMAALYLSRVREAQPRGPYRIGGASMGGMIAFEMAHQLHAAGEEVALLTLMDTPCLDQMGPQPMEDGEFVAAVFLGRVALTPEELRPLDLEAQLAYALDKAARSGAGDGFGLEEARRLVAVLRGNVNALYDYPPRPYPGRLLFFRALTRRPIDPPRPELPWIELAQGGLEIVLVPGDHQTMHEPPHVRALADRLKVLL